MDNLSIDSIEVVSEIQPPIYEYWFDNHHYRYQVDFHNLKGNKLHLDETEIFLGFADSASVTLNKRITIYKFITNEHIIDGASLHYFSSDHGLLLIKSRTWGTQTAFYPWANAVLGHTRLLHSSVQGGGEYEIDTVFEKQIEKELNVDGS